MIVNKRMRCIHNIPIEEGRRHVIILMDDEYKTFAFFADREQAHHYHENLCYDIEAEYYDRSSKKLYNVKTEQKKKPDAYDILFNNN